MPHQLSSGETIMKTKPLIQAGTILGVGLGGFFDEILFHQIFQLHNGLFHVFHWFMTLLGIGCVWRCAGRKDVPHSTSVLMGGILQGWGVFNLIEGIIDRQIIEHFYYDVAFLLSGVVMISVGRFLYHYKGDHRTDKRREGYVVRGSKSTHLRT
jgi:uncharacterized membrane protein